MHSVYRYKTQSVTSKANQGPTQGVLRVLEYPHQIEESKLYLIEQLAREEATHTATDL